MESPAMAVKCPAGRKKKLRFVLRNYPLVGSWFRPVEPVGRGAQPLGVGGRSGCL